MNEKVTFEDAQEMARRQDEDYIASLKMVGEGDPNYPDLQKEKEKTKREAESK